MNSVEELLPSQVDAYDFSPTQDFNPRLYKNSTWVPPSCGAPYSEALQTFEKIITTKNNNLPTCKRFNLHPLQRKAIGELNKNPNIVIYPSDKGLGPVAVDRQTYIQQVLKEHLCNKNNYVQLSADEAHEALEDQKAKLDEA